MPVRRLVPFLAHSVRAKSRAPYPHEVERLQRSWHELGTLGQPLMVAPFISESPGSLLTRDGWSWADAQGDFDLRAPGLVVRQRRVSTAPTPKHRSLARGSGSYAVIRALVGFIGGEDEEPGVTALAAPSRYLAAAGPLRGQPQRGTVRRCWQRRACRSAGPHHRQSPVQERRQA
jgi:hypothetical protein